MDYDHLARAKDYDQLWSLIQQAEKREGRHLTDERDALHRLFFAAQTREESPSNIGTAV